MVPPVYFVIAGELHSAQTKFENLATFDKPFVLAVCRCNRSVKKIVKNNFQPVEVGPYLFFLERYWSLFPCISTQAEKEWKSVEDKQRYLRLQLLLDKSNIYCQFLLERMERQKLEARKQQEKTAHQLQKKQSKEKDLMQMVILICVKRPCSS